jgi:hypothetical protein
MDIDALIAAADPARRVPLDDPGSAQADRIYRRAIGQPPAGRETARSRRRILVPGIVGAAAAGLAASAAPRAEQLFHAGLREGRPVIPRPRNPLTRIRPSWRLSAAVATAAALVAGIVVAVLPSSPVILTAQLLADRASAAALIQPTVNPGQWVYRVVESHVSLSVSLKGVRQTDTGAGWETADGQAVYDDNSSDGVGAGADIPSYSQLGSLPRNPAALDAYLANIGNSGEKSAPGMMGIRVFEDIKDMLTNYVLPPTLQAEVYQALAIIPGIQVDSHVTAIDGQAGVAFVLPLPQSRHTGKAEIILNASNYSFLAFATLGEKEFRESAVVRMVIVGAPGSTQPSLTPPTAVELLAEQADRAVTWTAGPGPFAVPGMWIARKLATSSGDTTVWATPDDSEQASYVNGKLQVCARSAACAKSTQWLMPAGPSYALFNAPYPNPSGPTLPDTLPQLLALLNTYRTGCTDVAGDCNAVNAIANMISGYVNPTNGTPGDWFLLLADIPGVTVQRVTDVTGQADVAFRFPFTDGITEILVNASTYQVAGYVRNGVETVITKETIVSGPGSLTPAGIHPTRR